MRINSLACTPLCPAEVDKHDWSRSDTSPRGKKRKAARSASLCRGARVKLVLYVPATKRKKAHDQINESHKKHIFPSVPFYTQCNSTSLVDIKTPPLALATLHHSAATTQVGGSISGNSFLIRRPSPSALHLLSRHTHTCTRTQTVFTACHKCLPNFGRPLGFVCWCSPIGNLRSRPLIAVVL